MPFNLGDTFPDFEADTNKGHIKFYDWLGGSWAILFSHPHDYTPVCTTELGRAAQLSPEFEKRGIKLIALSCDSVESHREWIKDLEEWCECKNSFPFEIIADADRSLAVKFGMLDPDELNENKMPVTARAVYVIGPDRKVKLVLIYPATSGRNFDELLRVMDSLQLVAKSNNSVVTPVDWKVGDKVIVPPTVSKDQLAAMYPQGVEVKKMPSGKEYMRFTNAPKV